MAAHARDSATEKPVDRRVPLKKVKFVAPTAVEGVSSTLVTELTAGERRVMDGKDWLPPAMWLDRELRVIKIGAYTYPMERVHYYEQAVVATTKAPPPLDLAKFTVGKRA